MSAGADFQLTTIEQATKSFGDLQEILSRQLYQVLQKEAAEYENARIIGALSYHFIW